ncbi:hypothetical protein BCR42DRAFT_456499 [Absidia repens]|uniref:Uncharacterized protein n=1 Tax=Absidia repens TaxID=90262 RepID=A0A1X2HZU8_9FUNG|nr:hypothetical protein BCR42DRAFT_456499 [Absidia repens]
MKSILGLLCIAATMTIANPTTVSLYYPGQSQPTIQPLEKCFTVANAAGQLPTKATASGFAECAVYIDRECGNLPNPYIHFDVGPSFGVTDVKNIACHHLNT